MGAMRKAVPDVGAVRLHRYPIGHKSVLWIPLFAFPAILQKTAVLWPAWHLGQRQKTSLTDTVKNWPEYWPDILALPHPSPRNNMWLRRNPWFEDDILPVLKDRVNQLLERDQPLLNRDSICFPSPQRGEGGA